MKITVAHFDIRDGIPGDPCLCPVIRAIRRETGCGRARITNMDMVWIKCHPIWLPHEEILRIGLYDKTGAMMPHEFELPWEKP